MKLTQPKFSEIVFEGEPLKIKHLTSREFSEFQKLRETDVLAASDYILTRSVEGLSEEQLPDLPLSTRNALFKAIIRENGLDRETEESEVKN